LARLGPHSVGPHRVRFLGYCRERGHPPTCLALPLLTHSGLAARKDNAAQQSVGVRRTSVWNLAVEGATSLRLDVGRVDDRRPLRDLAFDQCSKRLGAATRLVRNVAAQFLQALAGVCIIQRLV
jgi:hypothetical protein